MNISYNNLNLVNPKTIYLQDITGLSPMCNITTSEATGFDGVTVINNTMGMRNITLTLLLINNEQIQTIYDTFKIKQTGTLQVDDKKIECYVESIDIPRYTRPLNAFISLLCPQPYFEGLTQLQAKIASIRPLFNFPFEFNSEGFYFSKKTKSLMVEVENPSSVDVGMKVEFYANSEVINPSLLNVNTNETMKLNYTMQAGDTITVNTYRGKKAITLLRNGIETNIFNYKAIDFVFLQLYQGKNLFKYNADSNISGLEVTIYYKAYYAGV